MLDDYIQGKVDAITVIRALSGMFNPDHAVDTLAVICMITRVEHKDLDMETFKKLIGYEE